MRALTPLALAAAALFASGCAAGKPGTSMDYTDHVGGRSQAEVDQGKAQENIGHGMGNKAVRGICNLVTGIAEWPVQTYKGYTNGCSFIENKGASKTVGTLQGLILTGPGHALGRSAHGALELLTFWLPNPKNNRGVGSPLDSEYAWEMGEPYSIFKPTLGEGIKPWGRKLVHGAANGFAGILEVPGQIVKGNRQKQVGTGILKGFWFWMGRTAYGFGQVFTFILPNPKDNPGRGWEETWPWDALSSPASAK